MAALTSPNVLFNTRPDPSVVQVLTIEVRKANTGDTVDVGAQMATPRIAMFIGSTVNVRAPATVAGTVLTLPAGIANDSGYLIVLGL